MWWSEEKCSPPALLNAVLRIEITAFWTILQLQTEEKVSSVTEIFIWIEKPWDLSSKGLWARLEEWAYSETPN